MCRRSFCLFFAFLFFHAVGLSANPPNVVFILADDLGCTDLGCYGSAFYQTPNLDRLASQGVRFTQAYAACSVCSPTRASILTGKYPARLKLTDWLPGAVSEPYQKLKGPKTLQHLPLSEFTLAEALKSAGYSTCFIGKWHLGGPGFYPQHQGFDENIGGCELGSPPSYFSPYHIPALTDGPRGEYLNERLTSEALRFLDRAAKRPKPFFLYFCHYAVHVPLQAKVQTIEKYLKLAKELPPLSGPEFLTDSGVRVRQAQRHPVYAAMVESLDASVGRILDRLHKLELETNTIVVFTSDNGGVSTAQGRPTSNVPFRMGKGWPYEGGVREPLLIRFPGVTAAGSVCQTPVMSTDYYPTILQLAGLPLIPAQHQDGVSLAPLLQGNLILDRPLFWHYPHYSNQGGRPCGAVRDGNWKLVEWFENGRTELYDLNFDPGEQNNLATQEPQRLMMLKQELQTWRDSVGALMPTPNPHWHHLQPVPSLDAGLGD